MDRSSPGRTSVDEDRDAYVERGSDLEQIAEAGVDRTRLDALQMAPAEAGYGAEGVLGVVSGGAEVADALAEVATPRDDPFRGVARHSTKLDGPWSYVSISSDAFSDG